MQSSLAEYFSSPRAAVLSPQAFGGKERRVKNEKLEKLKRTYSTPRRRQPIRQKLKGIENSGGRGGGQQMILDVGQKGIGMEHCVKCGMVYSRETPSDVEQHRRFHNRFTEISGFRVTKSQMDAWKSTIPFERVETPIAGTLFPLSPKMEAVSLRRKFEAVVTHFVNEEIGYSQDLPVWDKRGCRRAFLFIADGTEAAKLQYFIAGLVLVDSISEVVLMPQQKHYKENQRGAFLGVDRIWVHSHLRRRALSTFLLDSARRLLTTRGAPIRPKSRVAFGDPNELGVKLAVAYLNGREQQQNEGGEEEEYKKDSSVEENTVLNNNNNNKNNKNQQQQQHYIIYTHAEPTQNRVDVLAKSLLLERDFVVGERRQLLPSSSSTNK